MKPQAETRKTIRSIKLNVSLLLARILLFCFRVKSNRLANYTIETLPSNVDKKKMYLHITHCLRWFIGEEEEEDDDAVLCFV